MRFLSDKAHKLEFGWNERPLTEADFHRLCRRFKISVQEMPLRVSGFYYRLMGRDFIAIDSRLTGNERLTVMFHELAHYLFHTPESGATANFHRVGQKTRQEIEADAFALCSIIPMTFITDLPDLTSLDESIPESMLRERIEIFKLHGI
jgi:Zn-dependent peptidase ImmA (M78 family)